MNWSLLQAKVALEAEAEERRKEQLRLDLEALNASRRRAKRKSMGQASDSEEEERCDEDKKETEKAQGSVLGKVRAKKSFVEAGEDSVVEESPLPRRSHVTSHLCDELSDSEKSDSGSSLDNFIITKKSKNRALDSGIAKKRSSPDSVDITGEGNKRTKNTRGSPIDSLAKRTNASAVKRVRASPRLRGGSESEEGAVSIDRTKEAKVRIIIYQTCFFLELKSMLIYYSLQYTEEGVAV